MLVFVIKQKKKVVWDFTGGILLCQDFLTNSNVSRKNNFPSVYYLLGLTVSIVPAKKNLCQRKGPPLSFLLLGKSQSICIGALPSNLCLEGAKAHLVSPARRAVQKDGSWDVLGGDSGGSRKGVLGEVPGDLGEL